MSERCVRHFLYCQDDLWEETMEKATENILIYFFPLLCIPLFSYFLFILTSSLLSLSRVLYFFFFCVPLSCLSKVCSSGFQFFLLGLTTSYFQDTRYTGFVVRETRPTFIFSSNYFHIRTLSLFITSTFLWPGECCLLKTVWKPAQEFDDEPSLNTCFYWS